MGFARKNASLFFVTILAILSGVFLRFWNIEFKPLWGDEFETITVISGHTNEEAAALYTFLPRTRMEVLRFYEMRAGVSQLIKTTALKPDHPPGYYLLINLFPRSVYAPRYVSALFGVFVIFAAAFFMNEVFSRPIVTLVTAGLISLSPLFVEYSQEGRDYMTWVCFVLLSTGLLARALRVNTGSAWILTGISTLAGLYLSFLHLIVVMFQGVAALAIMIRSNEVNWQLLASSDSRFRRCILSFGVALLFYLPWIYVVWRSRKYLKYMNGLLIGHLGGAHWLRHFENISTRLFINPAAFSPAFSFVFTVVATLLCCSAVCACLLVARQRAFMVLALLSTPLFFGVVDVVFGYTFSLMPRYHFPFIVGLLLSVSYLLGRAIEGAHVRLRFVGYVVFLVLLGLGAFGSHNIVAASCCWSKANSCQLLQEIGVIKAQKPELVMALVDERWRTFTLSALAIAGAPSVKYWGYLKDPDLNRFKPYKRVLVRDANEAVIKNWKLKPTGSPMLWGLF